MNEANDGRSRQDDDRAGLEEEAVEDHADVIRESLRFVAQQMMEAEVSDLVGAEFGERKPEDRNAPH